VTDSLAGLDAGYPVTELAVTMAVAATALPYLSRPLHRLAALLVAMASIAAVIDGVALPVNTISSLALGWGVAAGLHLAVGSPLGLPSADEISNWIADLNVAVEGIARAPRQIWGWRSSSGRTLLAGLSSCRFTAVTRPMHASWRRCGGSVSTGIPGPPSFLTAYSRSSMRRFSP
jgi:hypothetical protein